MKLYKAGGFTRTRYTIGCVVASLALVTAAISTLANPVEEEWLLTFRAPWNGEVLGTGTKRPNAEQWGWGERNMVKTRRVRLNPIGLYRVNQARAERGLPPLGEKQAGVVEVGAENSSTAVAAGATTGEILPGYVDNSTLPYFPPVRSQGSLGSCAQFSAVYYTLTHMTAMARNWDAKTGGDTVRFSPKWTYNMLNGGGNNGSWHYDAYGIAQKHGLATWAEFPYDSDYRGWCMNPATWRNALYVRASTAGKVQDIDTTTGLNNLKQLLNNGYVLNFATYINSWLWKPLQDDPATMADNSFVGKQCAYLVNGTSGGHSMTIVGYNDDLWVDINGDGIVTANEKGALRIANSWGTGWVEGGFCWLAYDAIRLRNSARTSEGIFWYDEATWVTARPAYTPQLIAEFTLNHLKRNQLVMNLGTSDMNATAPSTVWSPYRVLSSAGGAYAFDGTTVAKNGTFCLDLTDLIPAAGGAKRFYIGMRDSTTGDPAYLTVAKLVDLARGTEVASYMTPIYADAQQAYAYVDYDAGAGVYPPVAALEASPTSGNVVLPVQFDASASTSPNGLITSCRWDFGDGTTGSGTACLHSYTKPGSYKATLTVTDSSGASSTQTVTITAADPDVISAPAGLAAKVSGGVVSLVWTDTSSNETAFVIERGTRPKGSNTAVYVVAGTSAANTGEFKDAPPGGAYLYRVKAVNTVTGRSSAYSNEISVRFK